jgi:hypothetical protein
MKDSVCDKFCKDCFYYRVICEYLRCCVYFLENEHRRPCPAGTGCTAKVKRKKKAKGEWNEKG